MALAADLKAPFVTTSSKNARNVQECFKMVNISVLFLTSAYDEM